MSAALLWLHIAAGTVALFLGALAVIFRKGGTIHVRAGIGFAVSMLTLAASADVLAPLVGEPNRLSSLFVGYFVITSWMAARRRDGRTGWPEMAGCGAAVFAGAALLWGASTADPNVTPVGTGPVIILGGLCVLAGLLDLHVILRRTMTHAQRLARHLWRMCFAFFVATGSFFLGQQQVMPEAWQGSPILFVLAFAPFAVMLFWLVRVRIPPRRKAKPAAAVPAAAV